jgi:hypothetical protein
MFQCKSIIVCTLSFAGVAIFGALACNNSGTCSNPGGPVQGAPDNHCVAPDGGTISLQINQASCNVPPPDGGAAPADYGPTLDGNSGDEDDCKFHVSWTATPICENDGVVFTVVVTNKGDGTPLTGADMGSEVFLSVLHPGPTPFLNSKEGPPGTYVTDPAKFDQSGQWTVRFHFFENCTDTEDDSPHGHAAFFIQVP